MEWQLNVISPPHRSPPKPALHPTSTKNTRMAQTPWPSNLAVGVLLQSLNKVPTVLLRTARLAQSTSQYYRVVHNLHKARPSATWYNACTGDRPLLIQRLHKALPSTAWYYNACKEHLPVLLCTTACRYA